MVEKVFSWQKLQRSDASTIIEGDAYDRFNQLMTAEYSPLVEQKPLPGISTLRDRVEPEGGAVSVVNGEIEIDGTSQKTALYTLDLGRYLPGIIGLAGIGYRLPDDTAHYEFGYGNDNGYRFGFEVDSGTWYTFIETGGNRYMRRPRNEWIDPLDGTGPSGLNVDLSSAVLRMPFGWYGYLSIEFYLAVPDRLGGDKLVLVDRSGKRPGGANIEQPDLPIFAEADGGKIYIGGRQFGVLGRYDPSYRTTATPMIEKSTVSSSFVPLAAMQSKTASKWASVPLQYLDTEIITTEDLEIAIIFNATLTAASFVNIPLTIADETAVLYDESATGFSGGHKIDGDLVMSGNGKKPGNGNTNTPKLSIPVGGNVLVVGRSISGTDATVKTILKVREEW